MDEEPGVSFGDVLSVMKSIPGNEDLSRTKLIGLMNSWGVGLDYGLAMTKALEVKANILGAIKPGMESKTINGPIRPTEDGAMRRLGNTRFGGSTKK